MGKTTVCREVAERYGGSVGGMLSGEVRRDGGRTGFRVEDLSTGETGWLARRDGPGPRVGSYGVDVDDLERVGVSAIRGALESADLVVVDEVGPMEFTSDRFVEAVEDALEHDGDALFVVHGRSRHPLAKRVREEARPIEVTRGNRDGLPGEILEAFG